MDKEDKMWWKLIQDDLSELNHGIREAKKNGTLQFADVLLLWTVIASALSDFEKLKRGEPL